MLGVLVSLLVIVSVVGYSITQLVFGYYGGISADLVVTILCLMIFGPVVVRAFKGITGDNKSKSNKIFGNKSHEDFDEKYSLKAEWAARLVALACCVVTAIASIACYKYIYKDERISGAILVDAEVVKVEDKTVVTEEYDYIDEAQKESIDEKCEVTFRFDLEGETHEIVAHFKTANIREKNLKIFVKDNEFVATEFRQTKGIILTILFLVIAVINLFTVFFWYNFMYNLIGTIFASLIGIGIFLTMEVSFSQMIYSSFGSIVVMLGLCGIIVLFYSCYCGVQRHKHQVE